MDRIYISRRSALAAGAGAVFLAATPTRSFARAEENGIDTIVRGFMEAFEIPGVGIAIVHPGQPALLRGYGVRTRGRPNPIDRDTLFAIASNAKAFTSASLAILVDEGKLGWDEPVTTYLPEFAMYDPAVTKMMTVRDLLVHRSGLPLGAGDLMQFPRTDHRREEFLSALRHLKPARGFRAGYDYDNILYVVAGLLVQRVSGVSWEDFVTSRIFRPLGMRTAVASLERVRATNIVGRHARLGPPVRGFGKLESIKADEGPASAPAGGVHASVSDIVPWLAVQLAKGALPGGGRLWSEAQAAEMWKPQVITSSSTGRTPENPVRPILSAYALGWGVTDFRGRRLIGHAGGLPGQITFTQLLPEQGIGLAVFSNTEDSIAVSGLRYALLDHLVDAPTFDWIAATRSRAAETEARVSKEAHSGSLTRPEGSPTLPLSRYVGRYRDPWYGDIVVTERKGSLHIDFTRTPAFKSSLEPWGTDVFRTRFARGAGEDALVTFVVKEGAVTAVTMRALSPVADFSFDFHHLHFSPV